MKTLTYAQEKKHQQEKNGVYPEMKNTPDNRDRGWVSIWNIKLLEEPKCSCDWLQLLYDEIDEFCKFCNK